MRSIREPAEDEGYGQWRKCRRSESDFYALAAAVLAALIIFRQMPGRMVWAALIVMGAGVCLNVYDTLKKA